MCIVLSASGLLLGDELHVFPWGFPPTSKDDCTVPQRRQGGQAVGKRVSHQLNRDWKEGDSQYKDRDNDEHNVQNRDPVGVL